MGLAIKLKRVGSLKRSSFKIIVCEKKSKPSGKTIETIGYITSQGLNSKYVVIDFHKFAFWLAHGAILSKRLNYLVVKIKRN